MLKIRLARVGKKKKPTYRFIVNESARDTYGKALEILGHYNPFSKVIEVKKDRIQYWISKGAQMSPTVHNILLDQNVIEGDKVVASKAKKKKKGAEEEVAAPVQGGEAKPEGDASVEAPKEEAPVEAPKEEKPAEIVAEVVPEAPKEDAKEEAPKEEKKEEDKKE